MEQGLEGKKLAVQVVAKFQMLSETLISEKGVSSPLDKLQCIYVYRGGGCPSNKLYSYI